MLESKEPPLVGAIRETREETGFIAPEDAEEPTLVDGDGFYALFKQRIRSPFIPTLDNENVAYAWAPLDAPPEPLHPGLRETIPLLAKDSAMPMVTTPNAGMPAFAGARKRIEDAMETADDMTPEGWRGLVNGLMEFFAEEAAEPEHVAADRDAEPHDNGEKLTERDRQQIGRVGTEHREEMPGGAFLMPASRKYPVKEKQGGDWAYSRKLLVAAAREARMHGHEALADRADTIRKREFGGAEDENGLTVDAEHDGPWMSCMSSDGATMYRNKNVPAKAEILGKTVDVDARLKAHEAAEWEALQQLLTPFREEKGREPDQAERELIYKLAHHGAGVPAEREFVSKEDGDGGKAWNAWCRGIETKIEKGPFSNEPDDADVRPIPHTHNELEATDVALDSALRLPLAFDKESVRTFDKDRRMHVEVSNLTKACVSPYRGEEIPGWQELGLDPNKIYKLLRDPDELEKAALTFNGIQILQRHIAVTADDPQQWDIIGTTGTDARYEHPFVKNSLYFWAQTGIDDVESNRKKEISAGYHYRPDFSKSGEYEGEHFDGVMRDIAANHIATVQSGRVGNEAIVADSLEELQWGAIETALLAIAQMPTAGPSSG
jgi:hypothetical protein